MFNTAPSPLLSSAAVKGILTHATLSRATWRLALLVIGLAALPASIGCEDPEVIRVDAIDVRILAHDATWEAHCVLPRADHGAQEVLCGREVHVPVGAEVRLLLASREFICIFSAPRLGLRDFAAPGLPAELRFRPNHEGTFDLRGDGMCGSPHAAELEGRIVVESASAFRVWVRKQAKDSRP